MENISVPNLPLNNICIATRRDLEIIKIVRNAFNLKKIHLGTALTHFIFSKPESYLKLNSKTS